MIGLIVLVFLVAVAAVIIAHVRERRSLEASARFGRDLTDREIARNIARRDRPYESGVFGNDEGGRSYVAGTDGAVRRVHIVPAEDGGETLLMHRKLGKAERKKRKKAIRLARRQTLAIVDDSIRRAQEPIERFTARVNAVADKFESLAN
jgi:hypothetical protein